MGCAWCKRSKWCCCGEDAEQLKDAQKPIDSDLRQQRYGGYYDKDGNWVDHTFSCKCFAEDISGEKKLGYFIFFPVVMVSFTLGSIMFEYDDPVVVSERYDHVDCPPNGDPCTLEITLGANMPSPVYFNYELVNFYQSHRVYLNSKSDDQLKGSVLNTDDCGPSKNLDGVVIYPCGLLPQSIFTDRFYIEVVRDNERHYLCPEESCPRNQDDISWENYWDLFETNGTWERTGTWGGVADSKYKTPNEFPSAELYTRNSPFLNDTNLQLPYPDNSDLIVWMRTAVRPTFKKPFRVIKNFDLKKDDVVEVKIYNFYDPGSFGKKYFYLETTPGFGSTTVLIGSLLLGIGIFSCCMCAFVLSGFKHRSLIIEDI